MPRSPGEGEEGEREAELTPDSARLAQGASESTGSKRPPLTGATLSVMAPALGVVLFLLALALRSCVPQTATDERRCDRGVCVDVHQDRDGLVFRGVNEALVPVVLRVVPGELQNLRPDREPAYRRLDVGEQATLLRLDLEDAALRWQYSWRWHFGIGDPLAVPALDLRYGIPFGGDAPRRLAQGVGGEFSHRDAGRHSFDFSMPEGTPVVAAREGTVVWVVDGYTRGGPVESLRDRANAVTVAHADGTLGEYLHLRAQISVRPGQRVERGQLLAHSGHTGFSTTPHLHFHVARRRVDAGLETLPIRFGDGGDGFVPREGDWVEPSRGPRSGNLHRRASEARRSGT